MRRKLVSAAGWAELQSPRFEGRYQGHGKIADGAFETHLPSRRYLADVLYPWERRLPGGVIRAGKMPALPGRPSVNDFAVALGSLLT